MNTPNSSMKPGFFAIVILCCLGAAIFPPSQPAPDLVPLSPSHRGYDALVWAQSSAEYEACCLQAYNTGLDRLSLLLQDCGAAKVAIIIDLDETVFDNGYYQLELAKLDSRFSSRLWNAYEADHASEVRSVPGAIRFLVEAHARNVAVFFISNRMEANRKATKEALERLLGRSVDDSMLLLQTDTSDKAPRRKAIEDKFPEILYLGDSIGDFFTLPKLPASGSSIDERARAVTNRMQSIADQGPQWGRRYIILPNPQYGEWSRSFGETDDLKALARVRELSR